ncbi:hypothetical protein BM1_03182 [Bipolaris maydis]|nr:hypothetical protein BM1_03182 [Bipolaris maydis]
MYHDFRTGKEFKVSYDDHHNYDIAAVSTAMDALNKARNQWPQLHSGTFLPSPVPVELYSFNPGVGSSYINIPALKVFRYQHSNMANFNCIYISPKHHQTANRGVPLIANTHKGPKPILTKNNIIAVPTKSGLTAPFNLRLSGEKAAQQVHQ